MNRTWRRSGHSTDSGESFDVLLQLTFPITLILAFVVITELGVWKRQYDELYKQTIDTPPGISNNQRHKAIITLQEQLLLKAVREVFEKQTAELGLTHYESLVPTPDQVVDSILMPDFVTVTRTLFDHFGTATRRTAMEMQMRVLAVEHYKELVNQEAASDPDLGDVSLAELRQIASANEAKLNKAVAGEMDNLVRRGAEPQLDLIGKWIHSERATNASGEKIRQAWESFVNAQPADRQNMSDRFVNLKVLALQEILLRLNAPLQEGAVHDVL